MTLRWRFNLFIYLGVFIFVLNIPVVYFEIAYLNRHLVNLELIEDLYDNTLEIRRHEKNLFLYNNIDSVSSIRSYLLRTRELISRTPSHLRVSRVGAQIEQLNTALDEYAETGGFWKSEPSTELDELTREKLRQLGKQIVDDADQLLRAQRQQVAKATGGALRWPLITMGAMLLLIVAGARTTIRKVVRPLATIEEATAKVARGDYSPIPDHSSEQTYVDHLVEAFNSMAQELEAREEQVIHSRKIASLGTLVSGVAHELNNPINNIVLTADALNSGRKLTEERRTEMTEDILDQALRASEIVKNLLEFSRAQTVGFEALDLAALIKESLQISENHLMVSHVKLHSEIEDDLPAINGSRQGLQQVFLNLITNAVYAMEEGGDLIVRARRESETRIKIEVEDTGTGISAENLPHIFDPFFTTKEVGKGTGLGLSVSFGIIKKHGGRISVKSKPGQGTVFTIVLPTIERSDVG